MKTRGPPISPQNTTSEKQGTCVLAWRAPCRAVLRQWMEPACSQGSALGKQADCEGKRDTISGRLAVTEAQPEGRPATRGLEELVAKGLGDTPNKTA